MESRLSKCGKKGFIYTISTALVFMLLIAVMYIYVSEKNKNYESIAVALAGDKIDFTFDMIEKSVRDSLGMDIAIEKWGNKTNITITDYPGQNKSVAYGMEKLEEFIENIFSQYTYLNITANFNVSDEDFRIVIFPQNITIEWDFDDESFVIYGIKNLGQIFFEINLSDCYVHTDTWAPAPEETGIINHILTAYGNTTFHENVWLEEKNYEHNLQLKNASTAGDGGKILFEYKMKNLDELRVEYGGVKFDVCNILYNKFTIAVDGDADVDYPGKEMNLTIKDIYHNITKIG